MSGRTLTIVLLLAPALASAGVRPGYGGTVRIGVPVAPHLAPGAPTAADAILERATTLPLLDPDAAGSLAPGALAEVPSPEAGARAFRLRLRPGLVDASGRPLGAEDVAARLAALARDPTSPDGWIALPLLGADALAAGRAPVLAGVQVLSPTELLVSLAFPLPDFPWLLATAPAALRDAGPFVLAARRPGTSSPGDPVALARNDRTRRGRPFADALELVPVDPRAAVRLLEQRKVDLVLRPEATGGRPGPALLAATATVAAVNAARLGAGAEAVRRALASLDRAELARRFVRGPAEPLASLAALAGAAAPPLSPAPGWAEPPAPARIVLLADSSVPDQRALAERLQVKLFDRGLRAQVDLVDAARARTRLASGDYDVALVAVLLRSPRPALAAGQLAFAARGPDAGRRAMAALAGLEGERAAAAADRLARELDLFPLVTSGLRASLGPALEGFAPHADGTFDPGDLWLVAGGTP
ncbi:MAG TPA: ABC transporter substrate-binding protein [Anaeromyxobacter sp.]